MAVSVAPATVARYSANISAGSSWTSLSKCSGRSRAHTARRGVSLLGRDIVHSDNFFREKACFFFDLIKLGFNATIITL